MKYTSAGKVRKKERESRRGWGREEGRKSATPFIPASRDFSIRKKPKASQMKYTSAGKVRREERARRRQ
jgi:hypothetical protein